MNRLQRIAASARIIETDARFLLEVCRQSAIVRRAQRDYYACKSSVPGDKRSLLIASKDAESKLDAMLKEQDDVQGALEMCESTLPEVRVMSAMTGAPMPEHEAAKNNGAFPA